MLLPSQSEYGVRTSLEKGTTRVAHDVARLDYRYRTILNIMRMFCSGLNLLVVIFVILLLNINFVFLRLPSLLFLCIFVEET